MPHLQFYILLSLSREKLHSYAIIGSIWNQSQNTLRVPGGTLYPLLKKMAEESLIEPAGTAPAGKHQKERLHYRITPEGKLRLKEELLRMRHAVRIGEAAGFFNDELPPDIQRLLNQLR